MDGKNKQKMDRMIEKVLTNINSIMDVIDDLEKDYSLLIGDNEKMRKQQSIDLYTQKLERNLNILKTLKG